ncbi:Daunorubicin/doxorubicin resistance ABC transporter permease protein DrrB [Micromonospora sp. MW-13]|uniref:ABC transporter permease n=1 Tax=unclassified Micromonospora TaxID=2617518 RepID=UPI000E4316BC|nr:MULTISPECIES: ABC transporter permease [unclassified Micromonospora]MCX4474050.1 ABC transporter permease [Micromonospora sp. NBC_01655]RGC69855.1 Daunorubicin/doxorubicin resistance ABC transporter permease protein DrrB [Micromonospora sp. MW-13]
MSAATVTADTPLAPARRLGVAAGLRHTLTLAWRSLVQIKHNPMELLDLSIQPVMFVLLFTYVFGTAISGSPGEYLTFALPGIIVQNALFATMTTGFGLNTDLTKGVFDRLRALPIARWSPLAGRILADTVKQAWSVSLLIGVGAVLGFRLGNGLLGLLGAFVLLLGFSLAAAWISVLVGVLVSEPDKVQIFGFMVIFPLTFTSNVFVPTDRMPGWLQHWVEVNPVTILADALRGMLVGGPVAGPAALSMLWAVALAAVFAPLAVRALRRRV